MCFRRRFASTSFIFECIDLIDPSSENFQYPTNEYKNSDPDNVQRGFLSYVLINQTPGYYQEEVSGLSLQLISGLPQVTLD